VFTIYRTNAEKLDHDFLESLRTMFKGKEIEITVSEVDETEYLLRSPANRERLLRAVEDINQNRNLIVLN
jgi:antitoxin YefM